MSSARIVQLKKDVLQEQMVNLVGDLGDPNPYLIDLRSKRILVLGDCERIRAKVTTRDRVELFVDLLCEGGRGSAERTPFDVLVEILKESVHAHVAEKLLKALERAMQEDEKIQGRSETSNRTNQSLQCTKQPLKVSIKDKMLGPKRVHCFICSQSSQGLSLRHESAITCTRIQPPCLCIGSYNCCSSRNEVTR